MNNQSEKELESDLMKQLVSMEYEKVIINSKNCIERNLWSQLEKLNDKEFTANEFQRILIHLEKGDVFEKAETLRNRFCLQRDDGETDNIQFLKSNEDWNKNLFQVAQQIQITNNQNKISRFDVTILINGLPLVQIELKKKGNALKEAFTQIQEYHKNSYEYLFQYIQVFVISNGVNTKYYSNNKLLSFEQAFYWTDESNNKISDLTSFASIFLNTKHIANMICKYIVRNQTLETLMILRPYQYFAVEAIVGAINNKESGYIWHTTGSGKTLTSFKASQILLDCKEIDKVVFVVDRRDLDHQTINEFNSFSDGSFEGTEDSKALINQLLGKYKSKKDGFKNTDLIVTTIQKLNMAIKNFKDTNPFQDKRIVFIFDECHRGQFGKTHANIVRFFQKANLIGFTGTPIFTENTIDERDRTTEVLFKKKLHQYLIPDALKDEMVLRFSVENYDNNHSHKAEKEIYESDERIKTIVDKIIEIHEAKTHNKEYNAIMCLSDVDLLCKYYETFKKKNHDLKIATIFSYSSQENEEDFGFDEEDIYINEKKVDNSKKSRLKSYVEDYNKMFNVSQSVEDSKGFYTYYKNVADMVKEGRIDILLVVNMFLTGFDSKKINTLYVDKNLKYHGLIQAFSRTNRIDGQLKSHGNIVCFRNLDDNIAEAIKLFSNGKESDDILLPPYKTYVIKFKEAFNELLKIAKTPKDIDKLDVDEKKAEFIKVFGGILKIKNIMESFVDFKESDIPTNFNEYKSKYLDIYNESKKKNKNSVDSPLNEISFELELIRKYEINLSYILKLIAESILTNSYDENKINEMIFSNESLKKKEHLISKFISNELNKITIEEINTIESRYNDFERNEKEIEIKNLCEKYKLDEDKFKEKIILEHTKHQKEILTSDISDLLYTSELNFIDKDNRSEEIKNEIYEILEKYETIN